MRVSTWVLFTAAAACVLVCTAAALTVAGTPTSAKTPSSQSISWKELPVDLDRDGDVNFLATPGNSGNYDGVFWMAQVRTPEPHIAFSPARRIESEHVPLPPAAVARPTP